MSSSHDIQRRFFTLTAPIFVTLPMVFTATIFHQSLIADAKGVTLQWFAIWYIAFVIARVLFSIVTGPIVDRIGSTWLFCVHLVPLAAGIVLLIVLRSATVVPLFWCAAGVTSGIGTVVQMTVIAERVPLERLGIARSVIGAVTIVASAAGPTLYGAGLALGVRVPVLLWGSVALLLVATALGVVAIRSERQVASSAAAA